MGIFGIITIDNRDYMDTIIIMLENPQSLSPTAILHGPINNEQIGMTNSAQ